jgi:hypothetical protein
VVVLGLIFDDSFNGAQGQWTAEMRAEVGEILKHLEEDPYFMPDRDRYVVERCLEDCFCACQSISGWGGWKLVWLMECTTTSIIMPIESLIIMADFDPLVRLNPRKPRP